MAKQRPTGEQRQRASATLARNASGALIATKARLPSPPQRAICALASVCGAPKVAGHRPYLAWLKAASRLLLSKLGLPEGRGGVVDEQVTATHRCTRGAEVREQLVLVEHWRSQRTAQ